MAITTPPRLRRADPADVPALVALVTSAYRGEPSRVGWTTEADLLAGNRIDPELLRADMARPRSVVLVLDDACASEESGAGGLLACAHVAEEDGSGYFGMFSVRPDLQRAGLGSRLLAAAERLVCDEWQLPTMRMTVIDLRDELIAYYARRGYRRTGVFKAFPYGDERFGQPLRDDLRFEVLEKPLQPDTDPQP
jgi:ribosomal protein S18 acetylase RimI-like enzyme